MILKFKIFKIPVSIHLNFLIVIVLLSLNRLSQPAFLLSWVFVVTLSIILHELGHALAACYFGDSPRIELRGIAGLTYILKDETKLLPNIIISLAGSLVGLVIGLLAWLIETRLEINSPALGIILNDIIFVNLYWSLANLLPILPLDGGNISQLILTRLFQYRGKFIAYALSFVITIPLAIYFLLNHSLYLVMLTAYLTLYNIQMFVFYLKRGADSQYNKDIARGYYLLQQGKTEAVMTLGEELLGKVENPQVKKDILQLLSRAYYHNRDYDKALEVMKQIKSKSLEDERLLGFIYYTREDFEESKIHFKKVIYSTNAEGIARPYFLCLLKTRDLDQAYNLATGFFHQQIDTDLLMLLSRELYTREQFDRSLRLSIIVYNRDKSWPAAYNAACASARSGDIRNALDWLEKAIASGFTDYKALLAEKDLKDLAEQARFKEFVKQLTPR